MDEFTFLQHCKQLAGDTSGGSWAAENLAGFFQDFRPDGERLRPLFADIPGGLGVFQRLREVYDATTTGYRRSGSVDAYFIVHEPRPSTVEELRVLAVAQLTNWRLMAVERHETELVNMLSPTPAVSVRHTAPPEDRAKRHRLARYLHLRCAD